VGAGAFLAGQLGRPSGLFGRFVTARLMNRSSRAINELTLRSLRLVPDDRVLEVGFGGGDLIARLLPAPATGHVSGADFAEDMVELGEKRFARAIAAGQVDLVCAGVEKLPYDDEAYTKACTVNTIYFWPEPRIALAELHRVLKDGGLLVVGFSPRAALEKMSFTKHGFRYYEPDEVRALLDDAGFADIELVPGHGPRGEFVCASAVKPA
jgi:arsenite methyltransferase